MGEALGDVVDIFRLELALQLALATLIGGAIGLERELSGKPAGLRTNILICMGSALFTYLSLGLGGDGADPTRIAAQIVTGVGFIGAGTILHSRGDVVGLTSAATIWVVAGIGMALGSRNYAESIGAGVFVLVVLKGLGWAERVIDRKATVTRAVVRAKATPDTVAELERCVRHSGLDIDHSGHRTEGADVVVEFQLRGAKRLHDEAMVALLRHPLVRTVATRE